jgi:hypothetical protein
MERQMDGTIKGQTFSHCTAAPRAGVAQMARPFAPNSKPTNKTTDVHRRTDLFASTGLGRQMDRPFRIDRPRATNGQTFSHCTAAPRAGVAQMARPFAPNRKPATKTTDLHKRTGLFALHRGTTRRRGTDGQTFCAQLETHEQNDGFSQEDRPFRIDPEWWGRGRIR